MTIVWMSGLIMAMALQDAPPPRTLPVSELPIALVGVARNPTEPARSIALIRCTAASASTAVSSVAPRQRVCEVAEVTEVHADSVSIKNLVTSAPERLLLRTSGAANVATPPASAATPAPVVSATRGGVDVTVPKAVVDHYLLNLSELLTAALATPHFTKSPVGQAVMDGFELGQIKPGSVIDQLGLKNGDVIQSVNGEKLDSLAAAIRLASLAQNAAEGTMIVSRKGVPLTFVFRTQ
jgi:membrane-associated protease RseP (regulator of RpoE activity)